MSAECERRAGHGKGRIAVVLSCEQKRDFVGAASTALPMKIMMMGLAKRNVHQTIRDQKREVLARAWRNGKAKRGKKKKKRLNEWISRVVKLEPTDGTD